MKRKDRKFFDQMEFLNLENRVNTISAIFQVIPKQQTGTKLLKSLY